LKAVTQLLLPPGGLILLAGVGLIYWRRAWGRGLVVMALLLCWALATEVVRDQLLAPLEQRYAAFSMDAAALAEKPTAIVLLGGGIHQHSPAYGGVDVLPRAAMLRTVYAAYLSKQSGLPIYASGGKVLRDEGAPEAVVMRRVLVKQLGVAADAVVAESASTNTWQNAAQIRQRLAADRIQRVVLVTSAWHMWRAVTAFAAHDMQVIPAPCDYLSEQKRYDLRSYLPNWQVFADSSEVLHEYLGLLWYRLHYGHIGLH